MKWTEDLATGVTQIDDQHKELIERVNQLLAACSEGRGKEEVGRTLNFLSDYIVFHFGTEEKYMTQYDYPGYNSHKAQHTGFIKEFTDLKGKFETEGPTLEV
ncbi:MAG: bacteriohemerythrin, partial [Bacillota bacterium]|nr:bacteriohemerythrin [Bacillota bacterium]